MPDIIGLNLAGECDPNIDCLFRYWRSIHPVSDLPARGNFDPLDLSATCWPHICLLDVKHDPLWFQIRFVGTEIVRFKSGMGRANGSTA